MEKLNCDKRSLRNFGITMAVAFLVIAGILALKHKSAPMPLLYVALGFLLTGLIMPMALKHLYIAWMRLAFVLGWINTRLLLCVLFYLVFTPIGLALRLFGKDLLDRKFDKNAETYWHRREKRHLTAEEYERQF
ncbi:MAG: SxtJ family membrane protein [Candidatus Omnitrophica bacterium]|nr:SxtJ family membrane protein [Candidatus Omnitrophota bacterium]